MYLLISTKLSIRKKYRQLADAECQQIFTEHYCNQFENVKLVNKTSDSIQIDDYVVKIKDIDQYNNLNSTAISMPPQYLRYFRLILNNHFENADHACYLRLCSHFFINYFRQHMLFIDDYMPKEKDGNSFREWLLGNNNDGKGELRYTNTPLLKNLVLTEKGITWNKEKI